MENVGGYDDIWIVGGQEESGCNGCTVVRERGLDPAEYLLSGASEALKGQIVFTEFKFERVTVTSADVHANDGVVAAAEDRELVFEESGILTNELEKIIVSIIEHGVDLALLLYGVTAPLAEIIIKPIVESPVNSRS